MRRINQGAVFSLLFSSFLIFCNLYVIQPLIGEFSTNYSVSISMANWVFASTSLGLSFFLIPWALFAERFGRRLVMLLSLAASTAVLILMLIFSHSIYYWIGLRFLLGIALAGLPAVAVAYISEEFHKSLVITIIGLYIAANSLGGISGRLLGGFIAEHFSLLAPIYVCAILTLIGFISTLIYLPKERYFQLSSLQLSAIKNNTLTHITNPLLWRAYLIGAICFGMFINVFTVVGLRLAEAPWSFNSGEISLLFLCYLAGTLSSSFAGKFNKRFNSLTGISVGWIFILLGTLLLLSSSLFLIILGLLLCSVGFFFAHSLISSWVTHYATTARALSTALYLSCYYLGASLGGFYLIEAWNEGVWFYVPSAAIIVLMIVPFLLNSLYKSNYTNNRQ